MKIDVGMKVTRMEWIPGCFVEIIVFGERMFLGKRENGQEGAYPIDKEYFIYQEPKKRMAPALVLNSSSQWCMTKMLYTSLEHAQKELMGPCTPPKEVRFPASESLWVEV